MIICSDKELTIKGDLVTTIGPDLVTIIGCVYDLMKQDHSDKEAADFIDICCNAALGRCPDDHLKGVIEAKARSLAEMDIDKALDSLGFKL